VELHGKLANAEEDRRAVNEQLVTSLQQLKQLELELGKERRAADAAQASASGGGGGNSSVGGGSNSSSELRADESTLERLLRASRAPQSAPGSPFKEQLVGELAKVSADLRRVQQQLLEDPFAAQRRDAAAEGVGSALTEAKATLSRRLDNWGGSSVVEGDGSAPTSVDVVNSEAGRSTVSVPLRPGQTVSQVIEYAAQYWSADPGDFVLLDSRGAAWPLQAVAADALLASPDKCMMLRSRLSISQQQQQKVEEVEQQEKQVWFSSFEADDEGARPAAAATRANAVTRAKVDPSAAVAGDTPELRSRSRVSRSEGGQDLSTIEMNLRVMEIESYYTGGFRFSLRSVRHHCSLFFYVLLLGFVSNVALVTIASDHHGTSSSAIGLALLHTPFLQQQPPGAPLQTAAEKSREFMGIASSIDVISYALGPILRFTTVSALTQFAVPAMGGANATTGNASSAPLYSPFPTVQTSNVLVGRALLQQLRVGASCVSSKSPCYRPYALGPLEMSPYGALLSPPPNACVSGAGADASLRCCNASSSATSSTDQAFRFADSGPGAPGSGGSAWASFSSSVVQGLGDHFPLSDGGYFLELSMDPAQQAAQVKRLQACRWIDAQTRAVVFTVNFYNPNTGAFTVVILLVQFTTSNGVVPQPLFHTVTLHPPFRGSDGSLLWLAVASLVIYASFVLMDLFDLARARFRFSSLTQLSTAINIALLVCVCCFIAFDVEDQQLFAAVTREVEQSLAAGDPHSANYVELRGAAFAEIKQAGLLAIIVVLLALKVFELLTMNRELSLLGVSIRSLRGMIVNYAFVVIVFVTALAVLGHFTIGVTESTFATFDFAWTSVLMIFTGSFRSSSLSRISTESFSTLIFLFLVLVFGFCCLYRVFFALAAQGFASNMDKVRRHGYQWLPAINLEYRLPEPAPPMAPQLRKLRVAWQLKEKKS
jgi:hypothetical protein